MDQTMSGQVAAAALSGEKEFITINVLNTGDGPTSLIMTVLTAVQVFHPTPEQVIAVMDYIRNRFEGIRRTQDRLYGNAEMNAKLWGSQAGTSTTAGSQIQYRGETSNSLANQLSEDSKRRAEELMKALGMTGLKK